RLLRAMKLSQLLATRTVTLRLNYPPVKERRNCMGDPPGWEPFFCIGFGQNYASHQVITKKRECPPSNRRGTLALGTLISLGEVTVEARPQESPPFGTAGASRCSPSGAPSCAASTDR